MKRIAIVCVIAIVVCVGTLFAPFSNATASNASTTTTNLFSYTVQKGDSLYSIGTKFDVSWQSIASQNNIQYPYTISIGEQLEIPLTAASLTYIVQPSDTLGSIAQTYEVNYLSIANANQIYYPYLIYVGEQIVIPLVSSSCQYQNYGGANGSGWWCWSANTVSLSTQDLNGVASYFGVCAATVEQDNGYTSNSAVWNGEEVAIPLSSGCPITTQSWVWLWENYTSDLQALASNPGAVTVVSPDIYTLSDAGTFEVQSTQAEVCPQAQGMGLKCEPLILNDQCSPAGLNALLTNSSLQSSFIQSAVSEAVSSNLNGYNVDFEPSSGTLNLASAYGVFLTDFASAMHAQGKSLSVDIASWDGGVLWNLAIEAQSSVDMVVTMVTYNTDYTIFQQGLQSIVSQVPIQKVAVGLLTVSDDSTLAQRMQAMEVSGVHCVMVWPSYGGFLSKIWLGNLTSFMQTG
jgi:LysM repeat protein